MCILIVCFELSHKKSIVLILVMSFCFLSTLFFSEHLLFLTVLFDFTTPGTYIYVPATQDPMTLVYDLISLTLFLVFYMTANSIYLREKNICS